jgi:hypothetical protein
MKERIINQLSDEKIIRDLLKDMYGNYVLQKTLSMIQDSKKKQFFLQIVGSELGNLQYLPFGPKLIKKLVLSFPELKKYANQINISNNNYNNMLNPGNYYMNMNQLNKQMINLNINNISNNISNVNNYYGMMGMNNNMLGTNNNHLINQLQNNNLQIQNQFNMMNNYNMINNREQMIPKPNFNNFMSNNMFYN